MHTTTHTPGALARTPQPAVFVGHGGGPLPLMGRQPDVAGFLSSYAATLAAKPKAVVIVTGHWETTEVTVSTREQPDLLFDYSGFPPETYEYDYPAPNDKAVCDRIIALMSAAQLPIATDDSRGRDHGVFVPMMLMFPAADVPVVMLSLKSGQDAKSHLAVGAALGPLRHEGILVVGSGMSFHNFEYFFATGAHRQQGIEHSLVFSRWLSDTLTDAALPAEKRLQALERWQQAPSALECHPRGGAEHLMPLFVLAGMEEGRPATLIEEAGAGDGGLHFVQFEWRGDGSTRREESSGSDSGIGSCVCA